MHILAAESVENNLPAATASILTYHEQKSKVQLLEEEKLKLMHMNEKNNAETSGIIAISEGTNALLDARKKIAAFSFETASARLNKERERRKEGSTSKLEEWIAKVKDFSPQLSQCIESRPLAAIAIRNNSKEIITGGWLGKLARWDTSGKLLQSFQAHHDRISDVAYFPNGYIATASVDRSIKIWPGSLSMETELSLKPVFTLTGHFDRLSRIQYHPADYLISCSFDCTWRQWNIETGECLLIQDGHGKSIYGLSIHPDGSLVATGDLAGIVRIWDLRSGKVALDCVHHVKQVNAIDFHCDGFTMATGSDDATIGIWDLRRKKCSYVIPAHTNLITNVQFQKQGAFLLSSSFDKTSKVFSCKDWSLQQTFLVHEDKITRAIVSPGIFIRFNALHYRLVFYYNL